MCYKKNLMFASVIFLKAVAKPDFQAISQMKNLPLILL
jgi:hypothetical protein